MRFDINGRLFHVTFRNVRYDRGPNHELSHKAPARAITTCVIVAMEHVFGEQTGAISFVAIGNAVCVREDAFSRRIGRQRAFVNAVNHCGALRGLTEALFAAYVQHDPPPWHALDQLIKKARWEAGWEKRQARMAGRSQAGTVSGGRQ